ncbi:uncharacterized protein TA08805 [Theileria annulata]|uniref:RAP domain-containing protein n=1 Tax=Theileria annulata TaxID=5874 RepID=Q4U9F9_THEAN|nr:uncharacterized protein TA08805 [Theileria annulata]CAI76544.1 hypothetical protein, conserved [Theileria annulata]|eukprot:XP_953169.1 hypothetical protein, conserved [Theileria annulata]
MHLNKTMLFRVSFSCIEFCNINPKIINKKLFYNTIRCFNSESINSNKNDHITSSDSFLTVNDCSRNVLSNENVVDIMDDSSVSRIGILSREEFLSNKRTNLIDKNEYEKLKPHEANKYITSKKDGFYLYDKTNISVTDDNTKLPNYKKMVEKSKILSYTSDKLMKGNDIRDKLTFQDKKIYDKSNEDYYKSYFKDRERIFDGLGDKIKSIEDEIMKSRISPEGNRTRISPNKYWIKEGYKSPTNEEIKSLKPFDLKFVMMNEAKLNSDKLVNKEIWDSFIERIISFKEKVNMSMLLRYMHAISIRKINSPKVNYLIDMICSRKHEMKPKHFVFFFQALSRINIRDERLYDLMYDMMLCWPILRNNFIIKAANSVSKLGISESLLIKPLQDVIRNRIPSISGSECKRLKPITIMDLFTDEMIVEFIEKCEYHKGYFHGYSRNLDIIQLYLRLVKTEVYSNLSESTVDFLNKSSENLKEKREFSNKDDRRMSSSEHEDISRVLNLMGIKHKNCLEAGPFVFDIYEPKSKTVIEVNNKYQYYVGSNQLTSSARRRHEMISAMGYKLLQIPYRWWNRLESDENKIESLKNLFINI